MSVWQSVQHGDDEPELGPEVDVEGNPALPTERPRGRVGRRVAATAAVLMAVASLAWLGGQRAKSDLLGLPKNAELTEVTVLFEEEHGVATVEFEHEGIHHHYQLEPADVYAKGGQVVEVDATEEVRNPGPIRTFRVREGGRWANARLHEDGTVSGLFEHAGSVMRVRPVRSLAKGSATHAVHRLSEGYFSALLAGVGMGSNSSAVTQRRLAKLAVDTAHSTDFQRPDGADFPHDEVPEIGSAIRGDTWKGDRWFPGCYSGDSQLHSMELGIIGDVKAFQIHGSKLQGFMEQVVHEASFVYEMQMNIRIVIGKLTIFKNAATAPIYANDCTQKNIQGDEGHRLLYWKLDGLTAANVPFMASTHLFTSCIIAHVTGAWSMTVGLAWIGTICGSQQRAGVNMLNGEATYALFAHELGHNFNAQHSFEHGQGRTGGIMDYSDGKLNGVYQFNTRYRKNEMCSTLNKVVGRCNDKFSLTDGGKPPAKGGCKTYPDKTPCVFPFKYDGQTFNTCTSTNHDTLWCATSVHSNGYVNEWGTCRCCKYKTTEGKRCAFPNKYKDTTMNSCINTDHSHLWCFRKNKKWGNCDTSCS